LSKGKDLCISLGGSVGSVEVHTARESNNQNKQQGNTGILHFVQDDDGDVVREGDVMTVMC
jgi:hypothetical protein